MRFDHRLASHFYLDLAGRDTTLLSGSGRSGTSWVANICNYRNDFRYLFEPLNPDAIEDRTVIGSWCVSPEKPENEYLDKVLNGGVKGLWVDSGNRRFIAHRRLIKEIRSNFMLSWINKWHSHIKTVMITRNPLAVAASRISLNKNQDGSHWIWKPSLSELLKEPYLRRLLTEEEFKLLFAKVGSGIVLETIADWCINNLVVMRTFANSGIHFVYYEDLLNKPEDTVASLLKFIGVPFEARVLKTLKQPSETTRTDAVSSSYIEWADEERWRSILSEEEKKSAIELLELFGISQLYTNRWQPSHNQFQFER